MSYYIDAMHQLKTILKNNKNKEIIDLYEKEIKRIFCGIYIINYISNRIEFKKLFNSDYFDISFSCLVESFSLILKNYPRGASLVLRSSLENFIKFIIQITNNTDYGIDDKVYKNNKATLDKIIHSQKNEELKKQYLGANTKMQIEYYSLSGLSHSLTPESKNNTVDYFSDLDIVKKENISVVLEKMFITINEMFILCVMVCKPSFKLWSSSELEKIFRMILGKRKTKTLIKLIKL